MKPRSLFGPAAGYLGAAAVFLALDLYGLSRADEWRWTPLAAVLGQTIALTIIVGSWFDALVFADDAGLARVRPPPPPATGERRRVVPAPA